MNMTAHVKSKDIREINRLTKHLHMLLYVPLACEVLQSVWKSHSVSSKRTCGFEVQSNTACICELRPDSQRWR